MKHEHLGGTDRGGECGAKPPQERSEGEPSQMALQHAPTSQVTEQEGTPVDVNSRFDHASANRDGTCRLFSHKSVTARSTVSASARGAEWRFRGSNNMHSSETFGALCSRVSAVRLDDTGRRTSGQPDAKAKAAQMLSACPGELARPLSINTSRDQCFVRNKFLIISSTAPHRKKRFADLPLQSFHSCSPQYS